MSNDKFQTFETAWCPGCGDHNILECLKNALNNLNLEPHKVVIVGGIGQAAKTPQYINTNAFCGLHGRAVPPAAAMKIVNPSLTVIINSGEGDTYGEGGNHFIHNIRRNVDISHFVHNNQIYGLTKGQASPTSSCVMETSVQPDGVKNVPLNPLLLALSMGAGFVARGFSGEMEHLTDLMMQAITFRGYALVDILQPCVSFNKLNTFQWYKERVYKLEEDYLPTNKLDAISKSMEWDEKIPLGILYKEEKPTFNDNIDYLKSDTSLLYSSPTHQLINKFMEEFK